MFTSTRRLTALVAVLGAFVLSVGVAAGPAQAKPPVKPGAVTGVVMTLTKPADNYSVAASWNAATDTTSYQVALTNAANGAALATNTVSVTTWSASVNLTGVAQVRLTVTPFNGNRSGTAGVVTQQVPDLTAPNGTFTVAWTNRHGTISQTSLTDDSPVAQVTRTVSWGDNTAAVAWTTGTTLSHDYAADGLYYPTVTLKDAVGNTRVVALAAIVPGDVTAPVGTFTTSPSSGWQGMTPINLTQTSLSDDFSAAANVLRWIDWGDGSAVQAWTASVTATHVYAAAGTYSPQVILKDEAGNTRQVAAPAVQVNADTVAPVVKLTLPKKGVADEVSSWRKLSGQAADDKGTGVASVAVLAIEKRTGGWYFYKATSKTWAKAATKAKAWKRAKAAGATPTAKGAWVVKLSGLKKGTLFVKVTATDVVGNTSKPVAHKAVLTAP